MTGITLPPAGEPPSRRPETRPSLPLPDPYPDYIACPHCGEREVEVWCYQKRVRCHQCGVWIAHTPATCRGTSAACQPLAAQEDAELDALV